jgi:hypothetical protein
MGLYLDIGQEGFNHGFGQHNYSEPKSYAETGTQIDTRHGYISLYTEPTTVIAATAGLKIRDVLVHDGITVFASTSGMAILRPSNGAVSAWVAMPTSTQCYDLHSTGQYFLAGSQNQLQVCDVFAATSSGNDTVTDSGADWGVNVFAGGTVTVLDGTNIGETRTIASNTATQITVTVAWTANPDTTSRLLVRDDTAQASADNLRGLATFGGYYWAWQHPTHYLHFGAEPDGSDLEGDGTSDTAVVEVGNNGTRILAMHSYNNQLWVFKENGVWTIGEDDLAYHTLDFGAEVSANNFRDVIVWNGFIVFPVRNTLYKYRSGLVDMTPPTYNEYPPYKKFGDFRGLTTRMNWLYMLGTSNEVSTEEASPETQANYVSLLATNGVGWHKLWTIPLVTPTETNMWLDPVNDRLYIFGYSGGSGTLYYIPQQTHSDLPYADFKTDTYRNFYTSYYDFGVKRVEKSFRSLTIAGDFPTDTKIKVYYRIDTATTWSHLTSEAEITGDMVETTFPVGTTGKKIQFKVQLMTEVGTSSPHIKALILKVMLRPDVLYGVTCDILVSDRLSDQNRLMNGMTAADIRTALKACRDSVQPILFTSLHDDAASYAYLASLRFTTMSFEDCDDVESVARCTIVYV